MTTSVTGSAVAPQVPRETSRHFRYDIGGLRGLAIIFVVVGHIFALAGIHIIGGVDMSFALSGYLITWLAIREFTKNGRINMLAFYGRRVRRLLPAATLVIITSLAASWYWLPAARLREIAADGFWASVSGYNYYLGLSDRDYVPAGVRTEGGVAMDSPFEHYWSLAVEEQFYLVYPALLLLALVIGRRINKLRLTVSITLAIITAASLTASIIQTGNETNPTAYFSAHTRAWELTLGALVAVAQPLFQRLPAFAAKSLAWIGLVGAFVSVVAIEGRPLPGYLVGAPVISTLLVIIGGERNQYGFTPDLLLRFPPLQYIGKISYQWYLWHWPVLIIVPAIMGVEIKELTLPNLFMIVGISFALASLTWHVVDTPVRKASSMNKPGRAIGVGLHLVAASALAAGLLFFTAPNASTAPAPKADKPVGEVEQLVIQATQLQKLPAKVEATLPNIVNWDQRCIVQPEDTKPRSCVYGSTSSNTSVFMIGDSHVTHWVPALDVIAKQHKLKLVTHAKSRCTGEPYQNVDYHFKRRYTECEQWREQVYREVETNKPQAVIFSSAIYEGASGEATTQIVQRFTALGIKVVVFDDTPRPFKHILDCLGVNTTNVQACAVPRSTAMYMPDVRKARANATITAGGLFVRLDQWFCTTQTCPPVINGMVVYIDEAHIQRAYAVWLAPKLEEVIRPALS